MKGKMRIRQVKNANRTMSPLSRCQQVSSRPRWMKILPIEINGVLNSVVKKQPMKKSPSPLLKNKVMGMKTDSKVT